MWQVIFYLVCLYLFYKLYNRYYYYYKITPRIDVKTLLAYPEDNESTKKTGLIYLFGSGQTVAQYASRFTSKERLVYLQHFIMKYQFYERKCPSEMFDMETMDSGGGYCLVCLQLLKEEIGLFIWRDYIHFSCAIPQLIHFIGQRNVFLSCFCEIQPIRALILSLLYDSCFKTHYMTVKPVTKEICPF